MKNRLPTVISIAALVIAIFGSTPLGSAAQAQLKTSYEGTRAASIDGYRVVLGKPKRGPRGFPGPRGPKGATGPTGPAGAHGVAGPAGARGPEGTPGAKGAKGTTGARGPTGTRGVTGVHGATGAKGVTGTRGTTGAKGTTGAAGPDRLPGTCAQGQVAKYAPGGTTLACANDIDTDTNSGGTITGVTSGTGLSGSGSSGSVQLSLLPSFRLPQSCGDGQTAAYNSGAGTWNCTVAGAAYSAGFGLNLEGTTFSADFGGGLNQVARGNHNHFGQVWSGSSGTGLYVQNTNANNAGIKGEATGATGIGVIGTNSTGTGVKGETTGLWGVNGVADTGIGVRGVSSSGRGVFGQNLSASRSGLNPGVYGIGNAEDGVQGISALGHGVVGETSSTANQGLNAGVYGHGLNGGIGVRGESTTSPAGYFQSGSGWGLRASGGLGGLDVSSNTGPAIRAASFGSDAVETSTNAGTVAAKKSALYSHYDGCSGCGWAGYFGGDVRIDGGDVGIGTAGVASWDRGLTSVGPIRAGTGNASNCDLYLADDVCLYDEQNTTLSVRNFNATAYAAVKASSFIVSSDRAVKRDFRNVNANAVLRALAGLPIQTWSFKSDAKRTRHLGPMAQDFAKAFHLGASNKNIDLIDGQGVSMAAIKGLYSMVQKQQRQITALQAQVRALKHSH